MDLNHIQRAGTRAAYKAGEILIQHFGHLTHIEKKGPIDLVTAADIASEKTIIDIIRRQFPDDTIIAEESGERLGNSDGQWIIDPLDGTTNFAHSLGIFSVSIAYAHGEDVEMGIVYNPVNGELFTAIRGRGARLNDQPIHTSATATVADSLLVTGFPYRVDALAGTLIPRFQRCLAKAQGVRRLGSAALDLCFVACGRFEGFWEENLNPWDTAAGMLIAREAGGMVSDFSNQPYHPKLPELLATNGHIHQEMIALLTIKELQ